jgi:O-antigen ligase
MGAFNMFKKNLIFGIGPNIFKYQCNNDKYSYDELTCSTHPHNSYMQLLAETGIFFTTIIFSIFILLIFKSIKHLIFLVKKENYKTYSDYQICLMACFFITLWPFLPTQDVFNNWINVIYYLPVGFFLQSIYSKYLSN